MKKKNFSIITINSQSKMVWIRVEDMAVLECAGNYTDVFMIDGRKFTICKSLTECCDLLDGSIIRRVCAHYAINIFQIKEYIKANRTLKFSEELSVVIPEDKVKGLYALINDTFIVL
jgi:DNA-binding LytR/AlgR family response regulator